MKAETGYDWLVNLLVADLVKHKYKYVRQTAEVLLYFYNGFYWYKRAVKSATTERYAIVHILYGSNIL